MKRNANIRRWLTPNFSQGYATFQTEADSKNKRGKFWKNAYNPKTKKPWGSKHAKQQLEKRKKQNTRDKTTRLLRKKIEKVGFLG